MTPRRSRSGRRARGLAGLAILAGLALSCGGGADTGPAPAAPGASVLLIVVDTLRADHLGAYGFDRPTSPNIDALAAEGVRFERLTTVAPSTLASFTSILTSRHPHSHGVFRNGVRWPDDVHGVQEAFAAAGYETAGFVASYCLSSRFGIARGFDTFDEDLTVTVDDMPQNTLIRRGEDVTDAVLAWLDGRPADAPPFFALVHYFDPHWPYTPPPADLAPFAGDYDGYVTGAVADVKRLREELVANGGRPTPDSRHMHALHLGEIRYTDREVGRLLDGLGRVGLATRTVVVLTGDHGETFHEHPDYFDHGLSVYDTAVHVPLIVRGPGVAGAGRAEPSPVSTIDLAPTLLDQVGLPVPDGYEGRSFAGLLAAAPRDDAPGAPARPVFAEATKPLRAEAGQSWPNRLKARSITRGAYRLIRTPWLGDRRELYDLRKDPGETRNLWGSAWASAAGAAELDAALEAWSRIEPGLGAGTLPDDEDVERLRSLGYAE